MSYQIFLDDLREPQQVYPDPKDRESWTRMIIVRTVEDAIRLVNEMGYCPDFVSFDNDLQEKLEGKDFAKWLTQQAACGELTFPEGFRYKVHSANICAGPDIISIMETYLAFGTKRCMHGRLLSEDCDACWLS